MNHNVYETFSIELSNHKIYSPME